MSWVYWEPKSRMRIFSPWMSKVAQSSGRRLTCQSVRTVYHSGTYGGSHAQEADADRKQPGPGARPAAPRAAWHRRAEQPRGGHRRPGAERPPGPGLET